MGGGAEKVPDTGDEVIYKVKKTSSLCISAVASFPIGCLFLITVKGNSSNVPVSIYDCLSNPAFSQSFILKYNDCIALLLFSYCVVIGYAEIVFPFI